MDFNTAKMAESCIRTINEKIRNLKTLNIIVAGKTGVGKSTLINAVFRENLAETGIGRPVTTHMNKYGKKDFPLTIYDTRGFELGKSAQKEVKEEILSTIRTGLGTNDVNQAIHCIWYCINSASNRIEDEEIAWLESFTEENSITQVPVIIVLTQSFSKKQASEMRNYLRSKNLKVAQIVPVLALDYEMDEDYTAKAFGLDTLIQVMSQVLPDELQDTLQNVQKASLNEKIKHARAAVAATVTVAFGEGFAPVPFTDATLLIPTQVGMIATITVIFGLDVNKSIITSFVTATIGTGGLTIAGRTIAANLLKMVPGAGTIVGGAISGATAGLLTTAFGEAYIQFMAAIYKGDLKKSEIGTKEGQKKMKDLFRQQLKALTSRKKDNLQRDELP